MCPPDYFACSGAGSARRSKHRADKTKPTEAGSTRIGRNAPIILSGLTVILMLSGSEAEESPR